MAAEWQGTDDPEIPTDGGAFATETRANDHGTATGPKEYAVWKAADVELSG